MLTDERRGIRRRILLSSAAAALLFFSDDVIASSAGSHVIPGGQEERVLDMLGRGAVLPSACKLASASIDRSVIFASYECGDKPVTLQLEHPSSRAEGPRTTQFALVESGARAPGLLAAVETTVRQHEPGFHWLKAKPKFEDSSGLSLANRSTSGLVGFSVSLALVAFVGWKRKRAPARAEAAPSEKPQHQSGA